MEIVLCLRFNQYVMKRYCQRIRLFASFHNPLSSVSTTWELYWLWFFLCYDSWNTPNFDGKTALCSHVFYWASGEEDTGCTRVQWRTLFINTKNDNDSRAHFKRPQHIHWFKGQLKKGIETKINYFEVPLAIIQKNTLQNRGKLSRLIIIVNFVKIICVVWSWARLHFC